MTIAHGNGSYTKELRQLAKVDLLILDDWSPESLSQSHRNDLLEIIGDRHNQSSTIVTSRLPVSKWLYGIAAASPVVSLFSSNYQDCIHNRVHLA